MQLMLSDLNMLILAMKEWKADDTPKDGDDDSALRSDDAEEGEKRKPPQTSLAYFSTLDTVNARGGIKEELMECLEYVFNSLRAILKHGEEDNSFEDEHVQKLSHIGVRDSYQRADELYAEINRTPFDTSMKKLDITDDPRVKMTVALRALHNARIHIGDIEKLCLRYVLL